MKILVGSISTSAFSDHDHYITGRGKGMIFQFFPVTLNVSNCICIKWWLNTRLSKIWMSQLAPAASALSIGLVAGVSLSPKHSISGCLFVYMYSKCPSLSWSNGYDLFASFHTWATRIACFNICMTSPWRHAGVCLL